MKQLNENLYYDISEQNINNIIYFFLKSDLKEISVPIYFKNNEYDYGQINIMEITHDEIERSNLKEIITNIITKLKKSNPKLLSHINIYLDKYTIKMEK